MKSILVIIAILGNFTWAEEATYRVTFQGSFTKKSHPQKRFPSNPHFSSLVVAGHNAHYSMFQTGTLATKGVKDVAERGRTKAIMQELHDLKSSGIVLDTATAKGVSGTGKASVKIVVSKESPLISAITMIAPSPDWIVGVTGYSVVEDGKFVKKRTIPLYAYDAGTDYGKNFTSSNRANKNREKIHLLINVSGRSINKPFGTLIIEKL